MIPPLPPIIYVYQHAQQATGTLESYTPAVYAVAAIIGVVGIVVILAIIISAWLRGIFHG